MFNFNYYKTIADHPGHSIDPVDFDAVLSTNPDLDIFYKDAPADSGMTRGKTYHIHTAWQCGNIAEFLFINDYGIEVRLNSIFFDDVASAKAGDNISTIIAVTFDSDCPRALDMQFEILNTDPAYDLKTAIKAACTDYVRNTKAGWATWVNHCDLLNWATFWEEIPNKFCETYGFRKLTDINVESSVDIDEQLIDERKLSLTDDEITMIVDSIINQGVGACIDYLESILMVPHIPAYKNAEDFRTTLENSIRDYTDAQELWAYFMEFVKPDDTH